MQNRNYILKSNEIEIALEWEKYKGYTIRPVASTIEYYAHWIKHYIDRQQFLIYGGTPEIRTLFQNFGLKTTLIDRSKEMVHAMGWLTSYKGGLSPNETFLQMDWLDQKNLINSFDFIIGDDAINMVSWQNFSIFLQNVWHRLTDDGIFICHLLVKPDEKLINQSVIKIYQDFMSGYITSNYDLASRLNYICYDQSNLSMGWQQTIKNLNDQLNCFIPHFDFYNTFKFCDSHFYCPPQSKFESLVKKYFRIIEIFYPDEYEYCQFEPVYVLKKENL